MALILCRPEPTAKDLTFPTKAVLPRQVLRTAQDDRMAAGAGVLAVATF